MHDSDRATGYHPIKNISGHATRLWTKCKLHNNFIATQRPVRLHSRHAGAVLL
jgi:hypothetical protein